MSELPSLTTPKSLEGHSSVGESLVRALPPRELNTWALLPLKQKELEESV
jgi:hypothetical protein